MQCSSSGSVSIPSSSVRNSLHGEGNRPPALSTGILKMFRLHVRQQIPVHRVLRPIRPQPFFLALCPRGTVENIFLRQTAVVEHVFKLAQLRRSCADVPHFRKPSRQRNDKSKTVLQVESASILDEP